MVVVREGGREGGRVQCLTHLPRPQLRRTHAGRRTRSGDEAAGRRLSNVSHITERRRRRRRGRRRLLPIFESVIPKPVEIRPDPGAVAGNRGAGESAVSPAPPGVPRERFFGEPVFPGVQRLEWTVAIGCHSAFPGPDAATMLALLGDVWADEVALSIYSGGV